jgi:Nucleotidyltransferase
MLGEPDEIYPLARRALLDALEALGEHRTSLVIVGAQAIYLHTGEGELSLQPYTTDADLAVDPRELASHPKIESLLQKAGFVRSPDPAKIGTWIGAHGVPIDLLAPEALSGSGRRSADLGAQGNRLARRAHGLEAALVDNSQMVLEALEPEDTRRYEVTVAGPAALLIAKLHKIADRQGQPRRQEDKDALDVYRLLSAIPTEEVAAGVRRTLAHDLSGAVAAGSHRPLATALWDSRVSRGSDGRTQRGVVRGPGFYRCVLRGTR